jgi:HlyD family secretion protein
MKRWRWLIVVLVIFIVAAGGYYVYGRVTAARIAASPSTASSQTVAVQRGTLTVSVSSSGTIAAKNSVNLVFGPAGRVAKVFVKAGDVVTAGQTVMTLDPTDLQASVAKAKLNLATTENQLKKTTTGSTDADIASARSALKSAEANLAKVKAGPTAADLAAAQAAVAVAQQNLSTAVSGPTADDLNAAQSKIDQAKNSLWSAQASRDATAGNPNASPAQRTSAQVGVANAELGVTQAEQALAKLKEPATASSTQDLTAKVEQAKQKLADLKASPTAADTAASEAQLAQAQAKLATVTTGPTKEDVAIAQAQVDNARVSLTQAQELLDGATLSAPFAGVILSVNYVADAWVPAEATAMVLADLNVLQVTSLLSEVDVVKASTGNTVTLQFDAIPGVTLRGHVDLIAPTATIAQGVSNYPVTVILDSKNAKVRPGMSTNVTIITEQKPNVLILPNRAIKTQGRNRVVGQLQNGVTNWLPVTVGASNDTVSEITKGVEEGQEVLASPPNPPAVQRQGGQGGFGGPGGGFVPGGGGPPPGGG